MSTDEIGEGYAGPTAPQRMVAAAQAGIGMQAVAAPAASPTSAADRRAAAGGDAAPSGSASTPEGSASSGSAAAHPVAPAVTLEVAAAEPRPRSLVWVAAAGALLGAALAVLVVAFFGQSLGLANRAEVAALSRNLDTVQRNNETLVARIATLEQGLGAVRESASATTTDLAALRQGLDDAVADVALARLAVQDLEERTSTTFGGIEQRLAGVEDALAQADAALDATGQRMAEYDALLTSVSDLLAALRPPEG